MCVPGSGDFNGDADGDLEDYAGFQRCFSGNGVPFTDPACEIHDFDADTDVDRDDNAAWVAGQTGPI